MSQTWCESGSESGKGEGRMKKVGGYLRTKGNFFDFGCGFTYVVYQSLIPFHPHSSPSASWSIVPMVTVCDGFWMWGHHQVWLSLGKVIKTYYLWSNSHPVPFWVFLHLFLSSKEGVSLRRDVLPGGTLCHKRAAFQRCWDLGLGNKFILVETFTESSVFELQH